MSEINESLDALETEGFSMSIEEEAQLELLYAQSITRSFISDYGYEMAYIYYATNMLRVVAKLEEMVRNGR